MISATIFTPTHDTEHLNRLAKSVYAQNCKDFEWLIVPNGSISVEDVRNCVGINEEVNVRFIPYTGKTQNIGEIKNFCCDKSFGNILIEVDHDDEITPDCVKEVLKSFNKSTDFVYSNCCEIRDGESVTHSEIYGWEYRPFEWKGKQQLEAISFDPTPASFSKIWYAPNHVRAWKKSFYDKIGGHNKDLDVLDDQDIMCRTYISGNVKKIDKCLYIYHHTGKNTCYGEKNEKIQNLCLELHDQYIYPLAEKWSDLNKLRKIDLCGGFSCPPGYESIDKRNGDITYDMDSPNWPIESGSVGVVRAHDALEHMKDPILTMKEIYRILAPNGYLLTFTPSTDGRGAWSDPTHVSYWNSLSFNHYCNEQQARYINYPVKFQKLRIKDFYPSPWHQLHNIVYVKADLLKFDGRVPGLIEI